MIQIELINNLGAFILEGETDRMSVFAAEQALRRDRTIKTINVRGYSTLESGQRAINYLNDVIYDARVGRAINHRGEQLDIYELAKYPRRQRA